METSNKFITYVVFKMHHHNIVQDIQRDVYMALFEKQVLTTDEYQKIISKNDQMEEARYLLKLLPSKGRYGIDEFLNYLSIYYSWISEPIQKSITNEYNGMYSMNIQNVLTTGEVPQLSLRHISRDKLVKKLKELLQNLEEDHYIVVNGMTGCGKSSLVVEVLNDPLITLQYFQGFVQWIVVGRENSSDVGSVQAEILNRLNEEEQLISPPLNTDYEVTRKTLKKLWKSKRKSGLLILDDVCSNQIVKYLDIGCKILITTHDESIMDEIIDKRVKYLKVTEGFEEKETLNLFSKCLNVDYKSLPLQKASKLHNICKGFPLTISLIGAHLETHKEESINSIDRWKFYLEELSDKTNEAFKYTRRSHIRIESLEKAIVMCIKSLPDELQNKYQDFSIFVHDLNIKPEVLSVLWNLKKIHVEDVLLELIRKSLLVRVWIQPLNSYVYSIHDLLLNNLKKMKTSQESKALHKKLVDCYRMKCNGNFAELPKNDNYIFLYFGYHLINADLLEEFPQWYLNLKFLESKICAAGPADLLSDLIKYRKFIVVKSFYEEYIKEIEQFVKRIGPNLYQTKGDIIQLGLQEPETSFIYNESYRIGKTSGKSYFFYNIRPLQNCLPEPYVCIVRDNIETVIFGNKHDEVIIATTSGSIKVWNIMSNKCLYTYNGHTKKVTHLTKNKFKNIFLSTSDDSTIRIWNMHNFTESDDSETRTPSPESRQEYWQNVFDQNYKKPANHTDCIFVLDKHTGPVIFAQFSSDNVLIVSSSTDKTFKIWKLDNGTLIKSFNHHSIVNQCYFIKSTMIHYILLSSLTPTGSAIYACKWPFDDYSGLLYLKEELLSFFPLPNVEGNDKFLIMTSNKMGCYQFDWHEAEHLVNYPQQINYQQFKLFSISEEHPNNINESRFIACSLNNCTIQICELSTGFNFLDLNNQVQNILNLDWYWSKMDQSNWLLSAAEDKSIRLWCIKDITQYACTRSKTICKNEIISLQNYKSLTEKQNLYCYKLKQNFDAVWLKNNSLLVAAITKCGSLKILLEGLDQWSMINKKVSALSIIYSDQKFDETMIIVACEDLSVYMLNYQTSQYLFNTSNKVDKLYVYSDNGNLTIAMKLKDCIIQNEKAFHIIEIWTSENRFTLQIPNFLDIYVIHNMVIVLLEAHELMIIDAITERAKKVEINCMKLSGSLLFNDLTLAVINSGTILKILEITSSNTANKIDQYHLPFLEYELLSISMSNDQNLIVVGGQKNMILIDKQLKITKNFTIDPSVKNIQSIMWSIDDSQIAVKDDNQIIIFDVESGKRIASVHLTAEKFVVDSQLKTYIAVNSVGQLVMLNLH